MFYYLYKITNWFNGKIYIGVHKTNNLNDGYMGSGKLLNASINKYGIEYFTKEILQQFNSAEAMFEAESLVVNEEFVKALDTYNIKLGGYGGWDHCNLVLTDQRKTLFKSNGLYHKEKLESDEEYKRWWLKIASRCLKKAHENGNIKYDTFKGKTHSEETKKKIGLANSIHQSGSGNSQFGTCWIYNLELKENKKIKKDELEQWLASGWIKGRKQKF